MQCENLVLNDIDNKQLLLLYYYLVVTVTAKLHGVLNEDYL